MARLYRRLTVPGTMGAVLVLLLATTAVAAHLPLLGLLPSLPSLRELDYSPDAFGRIAPLRPEFIADSLGLANLGLLLGPAAPSTVPGAGPPGEAEPGASAIPGVPPILGQSSLRVRMSANRTTVLPGEDIIYYVIVRNIGKAGFDGQLSLESHVPFGTTLKSDNPCPDVISIEKGCVKVSPEDVPGAPNESNLHQTSDDQVRKIPAGGRYVWRFRVTAGREASRGTRISNHAHMTVLGKQTTSNMVVVTVA